MWKSLIGRLLLLTLFLLGCVSVSHRSLFISSPPAFYEKRITHRVDVRKGRESETFLAIMDVHNNSVQLVGMTTNGLTLFSLERSVNDSLLHISPLYSGLLSPDDLLLFLQLLEYGDDELPDFPNGWHVKACGNMHCLKNKNSVLVKWMFLNEDKNIASEIVAIFELGEKYNASITRLLIEDI